MQTENLSRRDDIPAQVTSVIAGVQGALPPHRYSQDEIADVFLSRDGFTEYKWVKDPNQANEMLDTMLQAEAAAIKAGGGVVIEK